MLTDDYDLLWGAVILLAGLGAATLGLAEVMDTQLLSGILGLSGDILTWSYTALGVAGGVAVVDALDEYVLD